MNKGNQVGSYYFMIHMIIEIITFYITTSLLTLPNAILLIFMYDFFAFVPQGIYGYLKDEFHIQVNFASLGLWITLLSLFLFQFTHYDQLVILVLSIGTGLVHIQGALDTLYIGKGKMTPVSLFVAGGSIGIVIGKLLARYHYSFYLIVLISLLVIIPMYLLKRIDQDQSSIEGFHYANKRIDSKLVILLCIIVVSIRSYMGTGIPTGWNKTVIQTILLYVLMTIGKALGGILIDQIGIKTTILISTLGSIPFLIFGNQIMIISLIGIMLFSMTMAITLAILVSVLPHYPGVAFGFTTLGLFIGAIPFFVSRINSVVVNCMIVMILGIMSACILCKIMKGEEK